MSAGGHEPGEQTLRNQLAARKGVDEGSDVEHERRDPEERHRRHVGREVAGNGEQQCARYRRQRKDVHRRQRDRSPGVAP